MMRAITRAAWPLVLATSAWACHSTVDDQHPVGGDTATDAEIERYVRRLYLDLTARPPSDDELATARQRIADGANAVAARRALAEELLATPAWAESFVAELENRFYGGDTLDGQYDFVCFLFRDIPPCDLCAPPGPGDDLCGNCSCPQLVDLAAERLELSAAAVDLAAGATTSSIERRFADTDGFQVLIASTEGVAANLIEVFLGREPQAEELDNASAMVQGALAAGAPAGLLYHRHGSDYADLIDILFTSEVYREAMVTGAFERYLGRPPSPGELRHFAASIEPTDPDLRPVILAITSSREYFQP